MPPMALLRIIAFASATVVTLLVVQPALVGAEIIVDIGGPQTETATLDAGEWRAYRTTLGFLESIRIGVLVQEGSPIDVFTTNEVGFGQYTDPNSTVFSYYADTSQTNTTSFADTFTPPAAGRYFVIVDNARITNGGATPTGPVTLAITIARASLLPLVIGILVVIAAVAFGAIWLLRSRRRKTIAASRPPDKTEPPT